MKITVLLSQPQFWLGIGVVVMFGWINRAYKRVGRRCGKCGKNPTRIHKIILAPDEEISPLSPPSSKRRNLWWIGQRRLRWWIRRVETWTFGVCGCGLKELIVISRRPISIWHAWWVKLIDRNQYRHDDELYGIAGQDAIKRRHSPSRILTENPEFDTPPVPILHGLLGERIDPPEHEQD